MAECEWLVACPFFNEKLPHMPSTADFLKSLYCHQDYTKCARYIARQALGKEKVPLDLFPNEMDKAAKIIADANKGEKP